MPANRKKVSKEKGVVEPQSDPPEETRYQIAPGLLERTGRSAVLMALYCRCPRCWAELASEPEMRASITFEEHRERIVECCSLRDDYIMPNMPLLEAVFRIILAKNEPVGLQEVHRSLMERWASRDLPRSVSEETLHRILRRDAFYGIQEIVPERPSLAANG